jgi:hypothetical protein
MLTKEKIKVYISYNGDIDMWVRTGKANDKTVMNNSDWAMIEQLLQDIHLVEKGLASPESSKSVNESIQHNCDNNDTINELKQYAKVYTTVKKKN